MKKNARKLFTNVDSKFLQIYYINFDAFLIMTKNEKVIN